MTADIDAPGAPGLAATWTSSAKDIVTTAIEGQSRIWLTLGHGIANEIYWPSTGRPQVRDLGFIVSHPGGWTEVKRADDYTIDTPTPGVLAPTVRHQGPGWQLRLDWIVDPDRDVVLVDYELTGEADGLVVLVAPHLGAGGVTNTAWVDTELHAMADDGGAALAVGVTGGFDGASAGFVGSSDGWQDFETNGEMTWHYGQARAGNVALTGALPLAGTLAVGFAETPEGALVLARSSLAEGAGSIRRRFIAGWKRFESTLDPSVVAPLWRAMAERSVAVLACHEDRTYPGATVASLSIPWGNDRGDLGGYHLVWARDAVECALGRLAVGDRAGAERTLRWLCATQQSDGHWTQNSYPDGRPFWSGVQLDEVALPVVLAAALDEPGDDLAVGAMVAGAVRYLVDHGPSSAQDRWEEDAGTNAFTLAAVVAALIAGGRWLDPADADYCTSLADYWNARIEDWLYTSDGDFVEGRAIAGYYVRLGRDDQPVDACGRVDIRNRIDGQVRADRLMACDFLALVRFGLRAAGDQRIVDTVALIDELLAVNLPTGVAYRRYNGDGYGEHDDGAPFDGVGVGRPWPLLAGERGHYEAQAGGDPSRFLDSMMAMAGPGGLLPEQVWDAAPIPERFLEPGRPTGSAMPLAWAHAEFIKLAGMAARGRPIEELPEVAARYRDGSDTRAAAWLWRVDAPFSAVPPDTDVVVDHDAPFALEMQSQTLCSEPLRMGRHGIKFEAASLPLAGRMCSEGREPVEVAVSLR